MFRPIGPTLEIDIVKFESQLEINDFIQTKCLSAWIENSQFTIFTQNRGAFRGPIERIDVKPSIGPESTLSNSIFTIWIKNFPFPIKSEEITKIIKTKNGFSHPPVDRFNFCDLFIQSEELGLKELNAQVKEYAIKNLTLSQINFFKSYCIYPVLLDFLNDINNQIKLYYLKQPETPVAKELKELLGEKNSLDEVTSLLLPCRIWKPSEAMPGLPGLYQSAPYLEDRGIKDMLRLVEILGAKINCLILYGIVDSDFSLLTDYLENNAQIISLNFQGMRGAGSINNSVASIIKIINAMPSLKALRIHNHKINDEGLKLIADALVSNSTLKILDLKWNDFSNKAISYAEEVLKNHPSIQHLTL
jgi:hypothetical protein